MTPFSAQLTHPSDQASIVYAEGKELLKKVTILLGDSEISLATRQNITSNLLADRELEKCINGYYSRVLLVSH